MAQRRARLKVYGRVQGVYYRSTAQVMARRMGVKGWVRNCPDGTVEILAEGDAKDLEPFLAWCERGPSGARVRKVDLSWEEARGEFSDFSVTF